MVFYRSSYPPAVRVWLKMVPSTVLFFVVCSVPAVVINLRDYNLHQHNEKQTFKSNFFERQLRERRYYYRNKIYPTINEQP